MSVLFLPTYWYLPWEWQLCKLLSSNHLAPNPPFHCLPSVSGLGLLLPVRLCQEEMLEGGGKAGEGRRELPFPVSLFYLLSIYQGLPGLTPLFWQGQFVPVVAIASSLHFSQDSQNQPYSAQLPSPTPSSKETFKF